MKRNFKLDSTLLSGSHYLGKLDLSILLLMDNAALPWLMLVPQVKPVEICDLTPAERIKLFEEASAVSLFLRSYYDIHKINLITLGNVVRQIHVHVIGRRVDDYCWPLPPIGIDSSMRYNANEINDWVLELSDHFGDSFHPKI